MHPAIPDVFLHTTAYAALCEGRLAGVSPGGTRWAGVYRVANGRVAMSADISALDADEGTGVIDTEGNQTREAVNYAGEFSTSELNGTLVLSGSVPHGLVIFDVIFTRVGEIND